MTIFSRDLQFLKQSQSISVTDEGISNCSKDVHSIKVARSSVNEGEVKVTLIFLIQTIQF